MLESGTYEVILSRMSGGSHGAMMSCEGRLDIRDRFREEQRDCQGIVG